MNAKTLERIMRNVAMLDNGCWQWTKSTNSRGYPATKVKGHTVLIRRLVYEHFKKPIKPGLLLRNTCGNLLCVNPKHHKVVTRSFISRSHPALIHKACTKRGHIRTSENTYIRPNGVRVCLTCYEIDHGHALKYVKTHCPQGHEYTPENTYYRYAHNQTGKMCKTCNRERGRGR